MVHSVELIRMRAKLTKEMKMKLKNGFCERVECNWIENVNRNGIIDYMALKCLMKKSYYLSQSENN